MQILSWDTIIEAFNRGEELCKASAVTIGSFDGLHRGHQALLQQLLSYTDNLPTERGASKWLVTFSRPTRAKKTKNYSGDLLTLRLKLKKIELLGFDTVIVIDFSCDFAKIEGQKFFEILVKTIHMEALFVGRDFSCGFRHSTDVAAIAKIAQKYGFSFDSIERVHLNGQDISSSRIRTAIRQADFDTARKLLGYSFSLDISDAGFERYSPFKFIASASSFHQVLPADGSYPVELYLKEGKKLAGTFYLIGGAVSLEIAGTSERKFSENATHANSPDINPKRDFDYLVFV